MNHLGILGLLGSGFCGFLTMVPATESGTAENPAPSSAEAPPVIITGGMRMEKEVVSEERVRVEVGQTGGQTGQALLPEVPQMGTVSSGFAAAVQAIRKRKDKTVDDVFLSYRDPGLIHETDVRGRTLLHYAAAQGAIKVLRAVLSKKPDVNAADQDGRTPIFYAADGAYNDNARLLMAAGADPNVEDKGGMTALQLASDRGKPEMAQVLLLGGAAPDRANAGGRTPLMYAAQRGNPDLVRLLLRFGANPAVQDKSGNTALHYACRWGQPSLIPALIIGRNVRNGAGQTPLEVAVQAGFRDCVAALQRLPLTATGR